MPSVRREIFDYALACEYLIADAIPFSHDELEWISYYATEMTNFIHQRERISRPYVFHERPTLGEYAVTSQMLFLTDDLSEGERARIRQLVADVTIHVLDEKKGPALGA